MAKTISQRISLEGSEDIRKQLEQLGKTGEAAFKQIQDAAKKPITDPAQIDKTKQAIDQLVTAGTKLGQQFQALTGSAQQFGTTGEKAAAQVTTALDQTGKAAEQVGSGLQQSAVKFGAVAGAVAGVFQAATSKLIAILGELRAAFAPAALLKGVVESGKEISDQADKIKLTTEQWIALRKELAGAGISAEDFVKSAEGLVKKLGDAQGGVARLSDSVTETTSKFGDSVVTILRFNDQVKKGGAQANQFASEIAKLGVEGSKALRLFAAGDTEGALRAIANGIANIGDAQQRAAAGTKLFGANWQEVIKVLRGGEDGINDVVKAQEAARKAARNLTTDQVTAANELKAKWDDLALAVRSLKDNIGALFIGGATQRAEWLTRLVDESRRLLQIWSKLAEEKKAAFLEGLGETPSEILFKTLVAVSTQLAGIWRDVLVPAGNALVKIFQQITGQFEGVSKSQVAAFFITATATAIGLSLALKGVQFVLTPLMALFSPFGAILLAAGVAASRFWGVLAAGAQRVAALIPNSLALIATAIRNLFAGNFAMAWAQFTEGATAAFGTLTQAAVRAQGPIGAIARGLQQIATDFPAAVRLIVAALIGLGVAATGVADVINRIFGTQLTGTDIAMIAIVLQLTGALNALASVAVIVGAAIGALAAIFGGPITLAIVGLIALVIALAANWERYKADALASWDQIAAAGAAAVAALTAAWDAFTAAITAAMGAINGAIDSVVGTISSLITAIGNAIDALLRLLGLGSDVGNPGPGRGATGSFAGGGRVGGRGTGTSDSNLAWVSRGEHIMPARAVRQPGVLAFLEALRRSGGNLSRVLDGMGRFAMGGLALPSFAEGGLAGMSNVTIQFPGLPAISGLRASSDVVDELRKAAVMAQVRSGGRKPSRYS